MSFKQERSGRDQKRKPSSAALSRASRRCVDWLAGGFGALPPEIQHRLLYQSLARTKTLVVVVVASVLLATLVAMMTAAPWAYAWVLAELLFGGIRLALMRAFLKAEAAGQDRNAITPVLTGLASFSVLSAGCYQCVVSGQWPLIAMAGIGLACMIGGISSRNAGTPRFGFLLMCILIAPFSLACLMSPVPYVSLIGLQLPLYSCGVVFVMFENYKVLLDLYHSEEQNRRLAQRDLLTGLPNRMMNLQRFEELLRPLSDSMRPEVTVFWLDLDGFKEVNDRFGHAAGDAVLVGIAGRLRDTVRPLDFVSRIGGDEFVILLPAISPAEAADIAGRIIACAQAPLDIGLPAPALVGISIGSARAPGDGETTDTLLRSADQAMYEAKRRGKGVYVAYDSSLADVVELAPAADADALMAGASGKAGPGNRRFPLPLRSKSL